VFDAAEIGPCLLTCSIRASRQWPSACSFVPEAEHERAVGDVLRDGRMRRTPNVSDDRIFVPACLPVIRHLPNTAEYERTSTTVINAYVAPLMARYLGHLGDELAARASQTCC